MEGTKGRVSELKGRTIEITQSKQQRENGLEKNKKEQSIRDL